MSAFIIAITIISLCVGFCIGLFFVKNDLASSGILTEELEGKYNSLINLSIIVEWFVLIIYLASVA